MSKTTSCVVLRMDQVENILQQLKVADFSNRDISILFPQQEHEIEKVIPEKGPNLLVGVATGVGTLGVLGGMLGWLVGIGSLSVPGIGVLIAAGPFMGTLTGSMMGAAIGSLAGFFAGLGIPEYEALVYENKLKEGWILISVHTREIQKEKREFIRQTYANVGGEHITDIKFIFGERTDRDIALKVAAQGDVAMRIHEPKKTATLVHDISRPRSVEKTL